MLRGLPASEINHKEPMSEKPKRVRKAVLPVAGLGTRFLPATKAIPKEMLTLVDKPLIQYAVEECIASGIEHMIFVTARRKSAIEDHFDFAPELEQFPRRARQESRSADGARNQRRAALQLHAAERGAGTGPRGAVRARNWWATSRSPCCWAT